jgi:hypothetical protein
MQDNDTLIFVGMKISDRLRDELDTTKASMKPFFREHNPEYLQIIQIENNDFIGKVTESGASFEKLKNLHLNVKTMLKMIVPTFSVADDAIKIYSHTLNRSWT